MCMTSLKVTYRSPSYPHPRAPSRTQSRPLTHPLTCPRSIIEGLGKLGIGVSLPVAELVLQNIAGLGSELITTRDFIVFLNRAVDMNAPNAVKQVAVCVTSSCYA